MGTLEHLENVIRGNEKSWWYVLKMVNSSGEDQKLKIEDPLEAARKRLVTGTQDSSRRRRGPINTH